MTHPSPLAAAPPRSRGRVAMAVAARGGRTRLDRLAQAGCLKALMPRGPRAEAVVVNTSGGITSGDRLSVDLRAGEGAALTASSQACERLYRAPGGPARMDVTLRAEAGARLLWLPQETIAFDGARLRRRIEADIDPSATLVVAESVILGRTAMGEQVRALELRDDWRLRRDGALVHAEALALGPPDALRGPAALGGALAFATVVVVAPDAEALLPPIRRALAPAGPRAGAAAWDGKLVARILAPEGRALRSLLIPLLETLTPLPRVWRL